MSYANFAYYSGLFGGALIKSADSFYRFSELATDFLDMMTVGRLADPETLKLYEDKVKRCICELSELFFRRDITLAESGKIPEISESIGAYSVTRANPLDYVRELAMTDENFRKSLKNVVFRRLGNSGLLYRGVE